MFTVVKKPKTPNTLWDAVNNRPLCRFVNGVYQTNDESLASKLKEMGHHVEGKAEARAIGELKVEELKAYAAEHDIDLGNAKSKADILKAIQETEVKG